MDASNLLKILVYYKDFSQVVFLDNTLSLSGEPIGLDKIGFQQAQLVCNSQNNGLWLYDQQNFALVQLNSNYEKIQQTPNLNVLLNVDLEPNFMLEHDNKIYVNNPATGILIFDVYGTYYKTIPVKNAKQFQAIGDCVYYMEGQTVKSYNLKTTEEKIFEIPFEKNSDGTTIDTQNFRLELGVLFIQTATGISIYSAL